MTQKTFRKPIEDVIRKDHTQGGRPPYDAILMYKITLLQQWYDLSDMSAQHQINDQCLLCAF
ncbi:MAG: transposase [Nitrososphaerota archaeon]|nr:transposase [Nitrososphaerota archaeon]